MTPKRLKALRAKHGLTQSAMAELIHCHRVSYARFETGTRKMSPALYELLTIKLERMK